MTLYLVTTDLEDPNELYLDMTGAIAITIAGHISAPRGEIPINTISGTPAAFSYTPFNLLGRFGVLDDGSDSVVIRFDGLYNDGALEYLTYSVDFLRSYYYDFVKQVHAADSLATPFDSCHTVATSKTTDWDRWRNVTLPVTGNYVTTTNTVALTAEIPRMTTANPNACYLVVLKCQNHSSTGYSDTESPGCSAVLLDSANYWNMLRYMSAGDHDNGSDKWRPSVVWGMIQGVYYMPGVTLSGGVPLLSGVNPTTTPFLIQWYDGGTKYVDLVTGHVESAINAGTNVCEIVYNSTGGFATWSFAHGITITLDDFRDIYYKEYKMYLPYIGVVDVPIKMLATYPAAGNDILTLGIDYVFNIYEGTLTYKWTALPGIENSNWHSLPQVPLSLTTSSYAIQMNNDRLALNAVTSAVAGVAGIASGNVGAGVQSAINIGTAIAETDMRNNAAAIGNVRNTSQSGFQGYAYNVAYLTMVETETAGTFATFMAEHGYPTFMDSVPDYVTDYRLFLETDLFIPWPGKWQYWRDEIKRQIDAMPYIFIKTGV